MVREKAEKLWMGGGAAACVLVGAVIWMFAISPELSSADSLRSEADSVRMQNDRLQANVGKLRDAYSKIDGLRAELTAARDALPTDDGLPAFTRQIGGQARTAGVTVSSLTAGTPTPVGPNGQAAQPGSAPAHGAASAGAAGGLYAVPITIVVSGPPAADLAFAQAVQRTGPRAALVTSTQIAAQGSGNSTTATMTLTMSIFVAPQAASVNTPGKP